MSDLNGEPTAFGREIITQDTKLRSINGYEIDAKFRVDGFFYKLSPINRNGSNSMVCSTCCIGRLEGNEAGG